MPAVPWPGECLSCVQCSLMFPTALVMTCFPTSRVLGRYGLFFTPRRQAAGVMICPVHFGECLSAPRGVRAPWCPVPASLQIIFVIKVLQDLSHQAPSHRHACLL